MPLKKIVILGSTGSIGVNTLKVVERYPDRFKVIGLTAHSNVRLLEQQIVKFSPAYVAASEKGVAYLKKKFSSKRIKILNSEKDLEYIASLKTVDTVVMAIRGSAALKPFLAAVREGKTIAPANKEALVIAGDIIKRNAKRYGARIIPVDSEQSAIFQCLQGACRSELRKVHLTASGGALLDKSKAIFRRVSVKQILNHPRWNMGKKITVDSASLMNKGFEVLEAKVLFDLNADQIDVVVHPEAVIHSMVEFLDGSIIAQLGITDMRLPIQYALSYPERWDTGLTPLDFFELKQLNFRRPDIKKFQALKLAAYCARNGGTLPSVLNAADEIAVEAFLNQKISFDKIIKVVEKVLLKHKNISKPGLRQILDADTWAREESRKVIGI